MHPAAMRNGYVHRSGLALTLLVVVSILGATAGHASQKANSDVVDNTIATGPLRKLGRVTGFPLPRYVSIKSTKARMRVGPSTDYPVRWVYEAKGLPMEIIEEYGNWRQVRDSDGTTGWMSTVLLSGDRTGLVTPWRSAKDPMVNLRNAASPTARVIAKLQPRVRLNLRRCDIHWCHVTVQGDGSAGYIQQKFVWGAYPDEIISEQRL